MIPVVTPEQMRAIDAAATVPVEELIERAGAAVARAALEMLGGAYGRRVDVLAGPGNNGADGRVAARRLGERGVSVEVHDALDLPPRLRDTDLLIDAAFGTGFRDRWEPPAIGDVPVLAVDVPTGLDAATGSIIEGTLVARRTVTFGAAKPGHLLGDGPGVTGRLDVVDIGLGVAPGDSYDDGTGAIGIVEPADVARWLPRRARDAHKWHGAVRIVAGSPGLTGAAWLAAAGAQRCGAGLVAVSSPGIDPALPIEAISPVLPAFDWVDDLMDDLDRYQSLVIGPGLGRAEYTVPSVVAAIESTTLPTVIDGDGLFAMSWNERGTPIDVSEREVPTVLTPHDGEYLQLVGSSPGTDRIAAARRLADLTGAVVLLKGPTTIVSAPSGESLVVDHGDERLASAGTGDVLSGIIGGLLAQGVAALHAAAGAAWIHAEAGHRAGEMLVAGDLPHHVAATVRDLVGDAVDRGR